MTAKFPKVHYATVPIQVLGDLPLIHAQIVFAAVDNRDTRAYLAQRCHVVRRSLIDGGFYAEHLNVAVFGPDTHDPCYRCISPEREGAYSCTRYALQAETQQIIPAIQNTAAVLAGIQAELGIRWLHGELTIQNKIVHADIRAMTMQTSVIPYSPTCPGVHWMNSHTPPIILNVEGKDTLQHLLRTVEAQFGLAQIRLPEKLIIRIFCTQCNRLTDARVPEWLWLASPRCIHCGGPFPLAKENCQISIKDGIYTDEEEQEILSMTCTQAGLASGTICEIWPETNQGMFGERRLVCLKGKIEDIMEEVPKIH